jgi:DNA (cytosine-5)-methyltransferase 1
VPDLVVPGYRVQRLDLRACEFGLPQKRVRHVQVGCRRDWTAFVVPRSASPVTVPASTCAVLGGVTWEEFCSRQGLEPLDLSSLNKAGRWRAVGNAVPLPMARAIARAVRGWPSAEWFGVTDQERICVCGCGRVVTGRSVLATVACRQRVSRRRRGIQLPRRVVV